MTSLRDAVAAIPPGRYIVAVSGGVDSMALLDCMRQRPGLDIIVAHVDHGIRSDSHLDAQLVTAFCTSHNILYISKELHLSAQASEDSARTARYDFLQQCRIDFKANSIVTAHHQDDLLETAIINMLRGTGWRGLAPFGGGPTLLRPLLGVPKTALISYAEKHALPTREDSTNTDQRYLRNYVRLTVMPLLTKHDPEWQSKLLQHIRKQSQLRRTIEAELDTRITSYISSVDEGTVSQRYIWCMLPCTEGYELFQGLCRKTMGHGLVRELAEAGLIFAKVAKPGKTMPLTKAWQLRVTRQQLIVEPRFSVVK